MKSDPSFFSRSYRTFHFSFFWRVERVSRADTKVYPCIIIFPPRIPPLQVAAFANVFSSLSSSLRFSPSYLHCFFLCLLGNLAVVTRHLDPLLRKREGYQWWRRVRRGWEGRVREDTVQERDLDAIFKSGATSILSPLSADSFSPSTLLLNRASLQGRKKRTVGYSNTALNRPRSLTLTRDHPLVRRGGFPHASRAISWISFRCFDVWGILVKTSSEAGMNDGDFRVRLRVCTIDRKCALWLLWVKRLLKY